MLDHKSSADEIKPFFFSLSFFICVCGCFHNQKGAHIKIIFETKKKKLQYSTKYSGVKS